MLLEACTAGVFDANASHAKGRKSKRTPLDNSMFAVFHEAFSDLANVNLSPLANFYHKMCVAVVKYMTSGLEVHVAIQMTRNNNVSESTWR